LYPDTHANTHSDTDAYAYADSYVNCHTDAYADSYEYSDPDEYANADRYADAYEYSDASTDEYSNPDEYSDPDADPDAVRIHVFLLCPAASSQGCLRVSFLAKSGEYIKILPKYGIPSKVFAYGGVTNILRIGKGTPDSCYV
jgi:hypothetical protein